MNIKDIKRKSIILFALAVSLRLLASFFLDSFSSLDYYEYGVIAQNLIDGNGFAFFSNPANPSEFSAGAYMPVGAVLYTVPYFLIQNELLRNILYLIVNHLLAGVSVLLLYRAVANMFSEKAGFAAALFASLLPEFIFASSSLATTNFYHLFVAFLLYFFSKHKLPGRNEILQLALISGIALLFRGEVALMILFIAAFLIISKCRIKNVLLYLVIAFSVHAPWTVRNYIVLDKFVPLTSNFGLNLYRGHNPEYPGAWADDRMDSLKSNLEFTERFELDYIELHKKEAIAHIKENPSEAFLSGFTKLFHLWGYYPYSKISAHPMYIIPWILTLFISLISFIKIRFEDVKLIYIMLAYHSIVAFIFFAIPRYQTMMKFWLLPLLGWGICYISEKMKSKRNG